MCAFVAIIWSLTCLPKLCDLCKLRVAIPCPQDCLVCSGCPSYSTGLQLRAALTCARKEHETYDSPACVNSECTLCKDIKLFHHIMCPQRIELANAHILKFERYEKTFVGQDKVTGEDKYKHDFFEIEGTGAELIQAIRETMATFNPHHDLAKRQDADWQAIKTKFPRGSFVSVQVSDVILPQWEQML